MAKFVRLKGSFGHECVVNIENVDAIIYQQNDTARIHVGAAEIIVPEAEARKLEKSIDLQS